MNVTRFLAVIYSLLSVTSCIGQLSETDKIKQFEKKHEKDFSEYRQFLLEDPDGLTNTDPLYVEYKTDLYKVERYEALVAGNGSTTQSIVEGRNAAFVYYDILLNKYYNRLLAKLSDAEKEVLRQSQRNWLKYRDSELELNIVAASDEFSGGGSIQRIYHIERKVEIVKTRLDEIVGYLDRWGAKFED